MWSTKNKYTLWWRNNKALLSWTELHTLFFLLFPEQLDAHSCKYISLEHYNSALTYAGQVLLPSSKKFMPTSKSGLVAVLWDNCIIVPNSTQSPIIAPSCLFCPSAKFARSTLCDIPKPGQGLLGSRGKNAKWCFSGLGCQISTRKM